MNQPSSTITFAFLAGQCAAVFWALIATFTNIEVSPTLVGESVILAAGIAGYFKKETVLPIAKG
jgi:hypothetical protein